MNCEKLATIEIPEGVTSIDHYAFTECAILDSVHIPKSVTSIGKSIFRDCGKAVININFAGTPEEWDAIEKHAEWSEGALSITIHCIGGTITVTPEITQ